MRTSDKAALDCVHRWFPKDRPGDHAVLNNIDPAQSSSCRSHYDDVGMIVPVHLSNIKHGDNLVQMIRRQSLCKHRCDLAKSILRLLLNRDDRDERFETKTIDCLPKKHRDYVHRVVIHPY